MIASNRSNASTPRPAPIAISTLRATAAEATIAATVGVAVGDTETVLATGVSPPIDLNSVVGAVGTVVRAIVKHKTRCSHDKLL